MNHAYSRAYAPVLRTPNLFHQNNLRPSPANYAPKYVPIPREASYNYQYPANYAPQSRYIVPSPWPTLVQSYPPQLIFPSSPPSTPITFWSNSMPTYSYAPTVSSKGLTLILIATLILVALDLVIVRPQKSNAEH